MNKIFDKFLIALIGTVVLAFFFPISGKAAELFSVATKIFVAMLFFLHGARLSREAVVAGIMHWRLHIAVLFTTFIIFPLLGLFFGFIVPGLKESPFYLGILYLCVLPSTVQSSIAFTSIAGGNVSAAVVSASMSNILGMFITPLLIAIILSSSGQGDFSFDAMKSILLQLLLPFILGQVLQRWIGNFIKQYKIMTKIVDRGSILMVVYLAFSKSMIEKLWSTVSTHDLIQMIILDMVLLCIVLLATWYGSKILKFKEEDQITITFCGSKKSLASGAPMANAIFVGASINIGAIVLPLMLFHQIQLIACTVIANHLAGKRKLKENHG